VRTDLLLCIVDGKEVQLEYKHLLLKKGRLKNIQDVGIADQQKQGIETR